ncbi:Nitrate reductase-like protein NarX [Corynebacterium occultum]|uniref:Nitrate reductase-like protein NarX n=1 Tax=Corynebacterium occultum TaxID=2675219 RepID=A0A6B8W0M8_9CORY|nr:nitrate reductase molybdenum cofactor assembly chaperone [Corynebacterium occultum]QGU07074.1 Nitrate reductase-like protein NarX [Corynebacterium occultum]
MKRTFTGRLPEKFARPVRMNEQQRRALFMIASLLLDYPDQRYGEILAAVDKQVEGLPAPVALELNEFLEAARGMGFRGMETHFVETFDQRRRCSLYLSYYAVGDTRQRGAAILAFRQQLQGLGFEFAREELADHLGVILEAAATGDPTAHAGATEILSAHRDGIEVLRAALQQVDSPFAHLVVALTMGLPEIDQKTADNYMQLIRSGPPAEMVGIGTPLPFPTHQTDHN